MARAPVSPFKSLQPHCVALNSALVEHARNSASSHVVIDRLQALHSHLERCARTDVISSQLADYVFFPVSGVFRDRAKLPVKAVELALRCLQVLLRTGWSTITDSSVAVQLLVLVTFLADSSAQKNGEAEVSDTTQEAALSTLRALFRAVGKSLTCRQQLLDTANVPAIGHAISVILDSLRLGKHGNVQQAAAGALQCFTDHIASSDVLQSFLPGIVSTFVHVLTPGASIRPQYRVTEALLGVLRTLVVKVLADVRMLSGTGQTRGAAQMPDKSDDWLKATAAQMKVALSNIARLQKHERSEVRIALNKVCFAVLTECQASLADSCPLMLETCVMLSGQAVDKSAEDDLDLLVSTDSTIADLAKSTLYDWLVALPRVLTSADEDAKVSTVGKIAATHRMLQKADIDLSLIDDIMASNLIDGLSSQPPRESRYLEGANSTSTVLIMPSKVGSSKPDLNGNLSDTYVSTSVLQQIGRLIQELATTKGGLQMARTFLNNAHHGSESFQIANMWLCTVILRARVAEVASFDDLLDLPEEYTDDHALREEAYSFALDILKEPREDDSSDRKMEALAIEVVTLQAQYMRLDFRPELVDALYPVVHLMGSSDETLRSLALSGLDQIAQATGYADAQDLLVQNVDYLVNAISLKLNSYDISPQAPQVLLMMTKLCGPKLLPYLEDLVDSTFDALEHFHGYAKLVELLFSVLNGIVEEGSNAPPFSIEPPARVSHLKRAKRPMSMVDASERITERQQKLDRRAGDEAGFYLNDLPDATPHRPWKELRSFEDELSALQTSTEPKDADVEAESKDAVAAPTESKEPPLTSTYKTITRITTLTQHHLPSSSPTIRHLLLHLLSRALPYLAAHEDTFLPLVHTLWPILIARLDDPEPYVLAGVLDVIACICEGAGDFVSGRVEGLWPVIKKIWKKVEGEMQPAHRTAAGPSRVGGGFGSSKPKPTSGGLLLPSQFSKESQPEISLSTSTSAHHIRDSGLLTLVPTGKTTAPVLTPFQDPPFAPTSTSTTITNYTPTSTTLISTALASFLIRTLNFVRLPAALYDECLHELLHRQLLEEVFGTGKGGAAKNGAKGVREALERVNEDAVWLVLERAKSEQDEAGRRRRKVWESVRPEGFAVVV